MPMRTIPAAVAALLFACNGESTPAQPSTDDSADGSSASSAPEPSGSSDAPTTTTTASTGTAPTSAGSTEPTAGPTSTGDLTTATPTTGGPAGGGVYARYEVRDNTDTPVEVWGVPWCAAGECYASDFGPMDPDCMHVSYVEQDRVGIVFELATGEAEPCYEEYETWADAPVAYFQDAECSTQPLNTSTLLVGGTLYYNSIVENGVSPATVYLRSGASCLVVANTTGQVFGVPTPVPASILGILPDAPYSLHIAD